MSGMIDFKPGNMLYPLPVVMLSMRDKYGKDNIITVAWAGTINTNPPMLSVSIRPERYSYNIIKESGEFIVNLTNKDLVWETDYCGVTSGRDVDKFEKLGLAKSYMDGVNAPAIARSPVHIACKVRDILPLGSHHMFIADVVAVRVCDAYMDPKGRFDLAKSEPIAYSHGEYYELGKKLGTFGFSVRKK